jgi:hypothetical protein
MHKQRKMACGKSLWKNLWRLWKSLRFPQLNRKIAKSRGAFILHNFLHKTGNNEMVTVLRNQRKKETDGRVCKKKLGKYRKLQEHLLGCGCVT